jgi:hypothetical protein
MLLTISAANIKAQEDDGPRKVSFAKEGEGKTSVERGVRTFLIIWNKLMQWVLIIGAVGVLYQFFRDNLNSVTKYIKGWAMLLFIMLIIKLLLE